MNSADSPANAPAETTEDWLLGGRVRLRQPRDGLRAGLDAVLLAAAVPARPGEAVLEAGTGSGAALLCLAARVPGLRLQAVELDAAMAALAQRNAGDNGLAPQGILCGDVLDLPLARRLGPVQQAFANPPFWPGGTAPPAARRRGATHEQGATLVDWLRFLHAALAHRGTLTLVLPTARLDDAMAGLQALHCGGVQVFPLWPRRGEAAKRVILRARKGSRGPTVLQPGLVLHDEGGFTEAAQRILRDGQALEESPRH